MTETQTYVYGVAAAATLSDAPRVQGLPDGRPPVMTIAVGGAAAIVSPHEGPALSDLSQPELLRRLTVHQRVIEDAMQRGDVLPVRFGTVLASEDEVGSFLARWGGLVRESLARFSGLIEVEVAATWDMGRTIAEIARQPEVVAAKAMAERASSAESLDRRVAVGQLVDRALHRCRALYQARLLREVGPLARDIQPNALLSDELVFNVAFLLDRQALPAFDAAIERLDAALAGRLAFRRVGPLPPYSFATVSVRGLDVEGLAAARALLDLPEEVSEQAVVSSYRRLARRVHPDHHPADSTAAERFAALTAARADLVAYCRSRARADETDGESTLVVTIERSGDGVPPGESGDD